ncbi:FliA/WhiG family RNA polymerase sigma factor [Paracerasibacillus soli]|uniref:FliA/WhiG family RNA polymerase sigma factor n=1 Tax=Paracerasibacillus soli TaxID=480284 RepID=A0ABU5CPA6_9BACI|nr:FliA/WhiG family RNA polymerase sigma factor [Virgibacillus soli]MDY0408183.1 FliA/WhiG family RNA polymerase sigma factor [Virgibacillus soli]
MTQNQSPLEKELWKQWLSCKNSEVANELMQFYMYLVDFHVERIATHLPASVGRDDLKSYGLLGLYDALNKFDQSRDLKFDTYASFRVRGAIIDGLRKEDWLPRSIRDKMKKIDKATQELTQKYMREPTALEIAEHVNMSQEEVENAVKNSLFANVLSIHDKNSDQETNQKEGILYSIPDEHTLQPDENLIQMELKKELVEEIKSLTKNEQLIISLFYHEELTLTEIGQILGLTTSRISRFIRKQSIN